MAELKTKMIRNSAAIYIGKTINMGATFVVFILMANYIGEEKFGLFSIAVNYIAIFDILTNFGLNQILIRELSRREYPQDALLGSGIFLKMALCALTLVLVNGSAFFGDYSREMLLLIFVISFNFIISTKLSSFRTIIESYFQANLAMKYPVMYDIMGNSIFTILILAGIFIFKTNLFILTVIYTFSHLPGFLFLINRFRKYKEEPIKISREITGKLFFKCLPIAAFLLFSILNTQIDVFLLSRYMTPKDVGYYSASLRLIYPLMFLSTSISMTLYPILSGLYVTDQNRMKELFRNGMKIILSISAFISVFGFFNAGRIIRFLYIPSYLPAAEALKPLMLSIGFIFINFYFIDFFIAIGRQKMNMLIMGISLSITLLLNILFIRRWGYVGSGYAKLLSSIFTFVGYMVAIMSQGKVPVKDIHLKIITLVALFALVQMTCRVIPLIPSLPISIVSYGVLLILLRVVDRNEIKIASQALLKKAA